MTLQMAPVASAAGLECALSPAEMIGTWCVARVKTHHEKRVSRSLALRDVQEFLPVDRNKVPLFDGYVFVCYASDEDWDQVRRHDSVYQIIEVRNQARLVRDLAALHQAIATSGVRPYRMPVRGQICEVVRGPYIGIRGKVITADERRPFVIQPEGVMGGAAELSVKPDDLEPVED